jgi:hypothetical protein
MHSVESQKPLRNCKINLSNPPRYIGKRNPELKQTRRPVSKKDAEKNKNGERRRKKTVRTKRKGRKVIQGREETKNARPENGDGEGGKCICES